MLERAADPGSPSQGPPEVVPTRRRAAGRLDFDNLAQEDIDEQDITVNLNHNGRLVDDELLSFVNVYFSNEVLAHDAYHTRHATHPEVNRHGSRIVWVENMLTGEMIPVARRTGSGRGNVRRRGQNARLGKTDEDVLSDQEDDDLLDIEGGGASGAGDALSYLAVPPLPPPLDDSVDPRTGKPLGSAGGLNAVTAALQRQEQEIAPIVRYHNLVMVQRATYLLFQGLLAGFCFTTIFTVQAADGSDSKLLQFYQPNAGDYRRFFYILATISLVGSIDLFLAVMDSRAESAQGSSAQQHRQGYSSTYFRALQAMRLSYDASAVVLAGAIAAAYAVAFLMTLLMSTFDVLTMVKDGNTDTADWIDLALADSEYSDQLQNWKAYNTIRVMCSVGAWIGSCLFVWKDLTQLNTKSADLFRLRETTVAWSNRVREMEGGAGLDALRPAALKKLLAILKVGVDRVSGALSFYEQEQQQQQQQQAELGATGPVPMQRASLETDSLIPK